MERFNILAILLETYSTKPRNSFQKTLFEKTAELDVIMAKTAEGIMGTKEMSVTLPRLSIQVHRWICYELLHKT